MHTNLHSYIHNIYTYTYKQARSVSDSEKYKVKSGQFVKVYFWSLFEPTGISQIFMITVTF